MAQHETTEHKAGHAEKHHESHDPRDIWRDFLIGIACTLLLMAIKVATENTPPGRLLELQAYRILQTNLSPTAGGKDLPVVMIDMTGLPTTPVPGRPGIEATSRDELQKLLMAVEAKKPQGIGVDVDFSPEPDSPYLYQTPSDSAFFDWCLQEGHQGAPILLGVKRTVGEKQDAWLGTAAYSELAASIVVPKAGTENLVAWTQVAGQQECPTMASLLANLHTTHEAETVVHPEALVHRAEIESENANLKVKTFPVDYSPLKTLQDQARTINWREIEAGRGPMLTNKVVLIGDTATPEPSDTFDVMGERVPGIFLHGCAIATLAQLPLYELSDQGRLLVDAVLSLIVIGALTAVRLYHHGKGRAVAAHRMQVLFVWLVVIASLVFGVLMVRWTRVLWDDFILVLFALALHPTAHHHVDHLHHRIRGLGKKTASEH